MRSFRFLLSSSFVLLALAGSLPAAADVPYPGCADVGCSDPGDFGAYLFLPPGGLPDDFDPAARSSWKYNPGTGMDVVGAWAVSTGRPDVVVAVLDSGIRWGEPDLAGKVALNVGELPPPPGCAVHDCNGDGFVSVADYAGVADANGNGFLDGQDLILAYSDGVDQDENGFVDDIAGWDFLDDDNDPSDDVDFGHGTGEAEDSTAEANNGSGMPGVAPNAMFLPLKVGDSFVAFGSTFAQAVVYATDQGAALVQEALGAIAVSRTSQAAIDYAYRRGVPVMASAADESSRHHNFPAAFEHTIWLNSIVHGDGTLVEQTDVFDLFNGCTNYGGRAWVAVPSNSCSSEATGRGSGLAALLVSHGRNLVDADQMEPYPGQGPDRPFSAEEIRQLFRRAARDVDHSADRFDLTINSLIQLVLQSTPLGLFFGSERYPTQPGWDQYTGYGKVDALRLLDVTADTIPPEVDLSPGLDWFQVIDPHRRRFVPIYARVAALRGDGSWSYALEVGCGVQPVTFREIERGNGRGPLRRRRLGAWRSAETAANCGFDPADPIDDPDAHSVTVRLRVWDRRGNLGEDRRTVALHSDPALAFMPRDLGVGGAGGMALADVDRDGVLEIVYGTADGAVHALRGRNGRELPGFPAHTRRLRVHPSPAWGRGGVPVPREAIAGATAADDLDGDGRVEIVVSGIEGTLYVFDDHGRPRPGFPVHSDPERSDPALRDPLNDSDPGFFSAPTLVDLDPPGEAPGLEIAAAGMDGNLYAWRADGEPVPGYPVRIADPAKVQLDPATGHATASVAGVRERGAKLMGSPAAGDLDGDGRNELVVTSNEEYSGEPNAFAVESPVLTLLQQFASQLGGAFDFQTSGRMYAVGGNGNLGAAGPFLPGWPVAVPLLAPGVLPDIGTGTPGSPALAKLGPGPDLATAIFGVAGPAMLFDAAGAPLLGNVGGLPRAFAMDFPSGFPNVPPAAGSADAPFFPGLGSGAFGDLDGDGSPEYVAPTVGLRKLFDLQGAGSQVFSDHQVTAWNPTDGSVLPAFPAVMDDLQFLSPPAIADVDGDGVPEIVQGSGAYLVRAYRSDGTTPPGFPKFTHGWVIATPTVGDVDGDGLIELVASTREGDLFVWNTDAPATADAIPWQGFGRDRRNTQNLSSGVSPLAPVRDPVARARWRVEAIRLDLLAREPSRLDERAAHAIGVALDHLELGDIGRALRGLTLAERLLEKGHRRRAAGIVRGLRQRLARGDDADAGLGAGVEAHPAPAPSGGFRWPSVFPH